MLLSILKKSTTNVLDHSFGALFALDRAAPLKLAVALFDRFDHLRKVAPAAAQVITRGGHTLRVLLGRQRLVFLRINVYALADATARAHCVPFGVSVTEIRRSLRKDQLVLERAGRRLASVQLLGGE